MHFERVFTLRRLLISSQSQTELFRRLLNFSRAFALSLDNNGRRPKALNIHYNLNFLTQIRKALKEKLFSSTKNQNLKPENKLEEKSFS
jgi:hypothetical protein